MYAIDHGHVDGGILYHGTLSNLDGEPKATWTCEQAGRKVSRELAVEDTTLMFLCYGLDNVDRIRRYAAVDEDQEIDPVRHHVVSYLFENGDQRGRSIFLIPSTERHPDFLRWLAALGVPGSKSFADQSPTEARIVAKARRYFESALDHVNIEALLASADRRVVYMLFVFGALKAFERSARLTQEQLETAFLRLVQETVGWFFESEGEVVTLMRETLTAAGDAELREIMQRGKKAIAAWHANPAGGDVKALGALLDEYVDSDSESSE
jgi:hypothetical protein